MNKEIKKLENCLKAMKKCLKIPKVENCICFSDAFKILNVEVDSLNEKGIQLNIDDKEKLMALKKEIAEITKVISKGNKKCIGCSPCIASVVFKTYPDRLNHLYLNNEL